MKYILIVVGVAALLLFGQWWWSSQGEQGVISMSGLHWHPTLEIYVGGEQIEIPENIGLGAVHRPMHTHDDLPVIHLEFDGRVREHDLMLGRFFENWDKDIRSFGGNMSMSVNGIPSTEYENYILRDGDRIELRYD